MRSLAGRMLVVSSLLALLLGAAAFADDRTQFARETGLDPDLVGVVKLDVDGTELTVVFVFINERTFDSKISASLRATLLPYVGRNAFYVNPNIKSVVSQFDFDPSRISVEQDGRSFRPEAASWVEITPGFANGRFEVNPAGASQGSGSEGILVLGDAIDADEPFEFRYEGERTRFAISASAPSSPSAVSGGPRAATTSHQPVEVPLLEDVTTLEEVLALPEFSSASMAALLELPAEDVQTVEIHHMNDEILRLLYVRLEQAALDSALGDDLIARLEPLVGTGAVMVWAFSATGVDFSPWNFFVRQSGTNYVFFSSASFVELTAGFIGAEKIRENETLAGVIRLPRGADPSHPFELFYSSTGVPFP